MIKKSAGIPLILVCSCLAFPVQGQSVTIPDSPTLKEVALFPRDFKDKVLTIHFAKIYRLQKSALAEQGKPFYEVTVTSQDGTISYEHNFPFLISPSLARNLLQTPLASNDVILVYPRNCGHI